MVEMSRNRNISEKTETFRNLPKHGGGTGRQLHFGERFLEEAENAEGKGQLPEFLEKSVDVRFMGQIERYDKEKEGGVPWGYAAEWGRPI